MKKICKICGKEFETNRKNKLTCKTECAEIAAKRNSYEYAKKRTTAVCEKCGAKYRKAARNQNKKLCHICTKKAREKMSFHQCAECRHAYVDMCVKIKTGGKILYKDTKFSKGYNKLLIYDCPNFLEDRRKLAKNKQKTNMKTNELMGVNDNDVQMHEI